MYKVLFTCIVLFPLEMKGDISAGHFSVELVEIRAHVAYLRGAPALFSTITAERVTKNC